MKAKNVTNSEKAFQPVKILLTLESENEVIALYSILNHAAIAGTVEKVFPGFDCKAIKDTLGRVDYGPTWDGFISALRDHFKTKGG